MWQQRSETLTQLRIRRYNSILDPLLPQMLPGKNIISFFNSVTQSTDYASLQSGGKITYNGDSMPVGDFLEHVRPCVLSIFDDVYVRGVAISELTNTENDVNEHDYEVVLGNQYTRLTTAQTFSDL